MKIKIFTTFYYPKILGGGEISTQLLVEGLLAKGIDVEVVTLGDKDESFNHNGVNIKVINCGLRNKLYMKNLNKKKRYFILKIFFFLGDFFDIFFYKKCSNNLKNCDILHITNYHNYSCIPLIYKLQNKNIKIIQSIRAPIFEGNNNFFKKLWEEFSKKIYCKYNKNIIYHFPTNYMYNYLKKKNIEFKNYFIIGNTVDIKAQKINFNEKKIDICYSGVIETHKGIKTLVKAIQIFKNKNSNLKVIFIGKGTLEYEVKKSEINVTGWLSREENYKKIKESKLLILPSEINEAFGRVLIEAIQLGTLVIGSDSGAIPEILNYNKKYIFKAKNYDELKEKIERVLNLSEEEYINEVEFLRSEINKYSYEKHILDFIKKYDEVLDKRG